MPWCQDPIGLRPSGPEGLVDCGKCWWLKVDVFVSIPCSATPLQCWMPKCPLHPLVQMASRHPSFTTIHHHVPITYALTYHLLSSCTSVFSWILHGFFMVFSNHLQFRSEATYLIASLKGFSVAPPMERRGRLPNQAMADGANGILSRWGGPLPDYIQWPYWKCCHSDPWSICQEMKHMYKTLKRKKIQKIAQIDNKIHVYSMHMYI